MARPSSIKMLVLLLVVLELGCAALLKGKLPISTPCSQCMESYIADRDDNPQRIQSYIINGIRYGKDATYFASVFANSFPFYYTKAFLNKLQDMQWRVDNHFASCGGQTTGYFDDDMGSSKILMKIYLNILDDAFQYQSVNVNQLTFHKNYLRYLKLKSNSTIYQKYYKSTNGLYTSNVDYLLFKFYLNSMTIGPLNSLYNCASWFKGLVVNNKDYYDQYLGFLPLQNPEMKGDYIYTLDYLGYYQYDRKSFDVKSLQTNPPSPYFSIGTVNPQDLASKKCANPIDPSSIFSSKRLLQTLNTDLGLFNIPLESLKPGQPSIMSPQLINMLGDINMSPDMFDILGDPLIFDNSAFAPGESPYTIWANFAAMVFGPVLYCKVPGIINALKASCPGTCSA